MGDQTLNAIVRENVRALRKARGWSAQRLAEALAVYGDRCGLSSRAVLANWEVGRREGVTVDDLACLAIVLDVDPPWSLTEVPRCATCRGVPPPGYACLSCGARGGPDDRK